ncbi:MAG: hypothetical protein ACFFDM_06105 [Candidatus Thorarchaeota archaeon]
MSKKTSSSASLRTLKGQCDDISLKSGEHILLASAPNPQSTLATAILCRAIMKTGGTFHVSFEQPSMNIDSINAIRNEHASSTIIFIGIETVGKKKLRKGRGYPVFVGGTSESEQVSSVTLGDAHTIPASVYILAQEHLTVSDYDLQLAASAALIYDNSIVSPKKPSAANKALVKQAIDKNLLEKRGGIRLFGFSFLPLDEVLLFSIRPYIQGISGNQKACDAFLNEADVPITKLRSPMSSLSNSEIQHFTQHLTSHLLEKVGPGIIPYTFGTDYVLNLENENSPLKHLSGIEAIADTAWARQELGVAMSIWIGDRSRALRTAIDTYLSHSKDVVSAVLRLETKMKVTSSEDSTIIDLSGVQDIFLTDVGRIILQNEIVDPERPLAISNEKSSLIIWSYKNVNVNQILNRVENQDLTPTTTSTQSIKFEGMTPELRMEVLKLVKDLSGRKR